MKVHDIYSTPAAADTASAPSTGSTEAFLPFALPDIGEAEIAEVVDTLRSGWITTGPKTKRFELDFARFLGDDVEAIAVNSATAGLHLALEALGVGPGDEVITTTHTFTATAEVARYLGAEPVLVDIERDTLCMDPEQAERSITSRTKVLLPVHFGGRAAAMDRIGALAARHGLAVVEDAAHALPASDHGKLIGTLASDCTVFSFYANKAITTGEGGMLVTRRSDVAKRARVMRLHGMNREAFDRFTARAPGWNYEIIAPGFKYNMTDVAAAIGIQQLPRARAFQERRAQISARYDAAFAALPVRLPPQPLPGDLHAWHLYVLQLGPAAPVSRNQFIEMLFAMNIGCSVHYIPLHAHPYWRDRYRLTPDMFPVSEEIWRRSVSLPIYTRMSNSDVERVVAAVTNILGR